MTQLTKEYFDKTIRTQSKELKGLMDNQSDKFRALVKSEIEELARITNKGFEDVIKRLDVRERVEKLERDMGKVREALNL